MSFLFCSVSEPQKSRRGFLIVISYTIKTVVRNSDRQVAGGGKGGGGQDEEEDEGGGAKTNGGPSGAAAVKTYTVTRSYSSVKVRGVPEKLVGYHLEGESS